MEKCIKDKNIFLFFKSIRQRFFFLEALNFLDKSQFFIDMCKYIIKGGFPILLFFLGVTSLLTLLIPFF